MQAEFVNPFIESCQYVFTKTAGLTTKIGQVFVKTANAQEDCVGICLGITGKIRGQVVFSMKKTVACGIASTMMMMKINELDEISRSAVSELTNMVMGKTASVLFDKGIKIDITPPAFLLGENLQCLTTSKVKTLCIPFILEDGERIEADIIVVKEEL